MLVALALAGLPGAPLDPVLLLVALVLSVLIGVTLGLLGGGGSILTTPILIYALGMEPKSAIATSLLVVCVTSIAGLVQHARAGNVHWRTGVVFGAAGMAGAFVGGLAAGWIPARVLMGLFTSLMLVTSIAMLRGRQELAPHGGEAPWKIVVNGAAVGAVTGLVGAGGGFVIVPALVLLGGLPMQRAIGTSLLVIAMNTLAGFAGHAGHVEVDFGIAAMVSGAAVAGSLVGSRLGTRLRPDTLRRGFGAFVLVMALFLIYRQL